MDNRYLGRSGLMVSVLGCGCDNFGHRCDPAESAAIVQKALDLGITLFVIEGFWFFSSTIRVAEFAAPKDTFEEYLADVRNAVTTID